MSEPNHPQVSLRTGDLTALSAALDRDAHGFATEAARLLARIAGPTDGERVYGADPAVPAAAHAMARHEAAHREAVRLIGEITAEHRALSRLTGEAAATFHDRDAHNASDVDAARPDPLA